MRYSKYVLTVCGIALLFCGGCASLLDKAGQALDGSAFAEKKIAVYQAVKKDGAEVDMEMWEMRSKAGEGSYIITLGQFPSIKIRCTLPDESGDFNLTALDYLGGNPHGWNEYRLDLHGQGTLWMGGTAALITIPDEIEPVQISWGRIRRYDTRITGTEALTNLRNRHERIMALCEWMNSLEGSPKGIEQSEFESYWKPLLFPELVPKKQKPVLWRQDTDQWNMAEDIRWNTGYTERTFPELLRPIRNSGTMLRDWEEAIDWLYLEYEWQRITEQLSKETMLHKKK